MTAAPAAAPAVPRHGRHLPEMSAAAFFPVLPAGLRDALLADGFAVQRFTRPYLTTRGVLQVRVVFRRRGTGDTVTLNCTVRSPVPGSLLDALADSMAAGLDG